MSIRKNQLVYPVSMVTACLMVALTLGTVNHFHKASLTPHNLTCCQEGETSGCRLEG
jgi:hypothetical protein